MPTHVYVLAGPTGVIRVFADARRAVRELATYGPLAAGSVDAAVGLLALGRTAMLADDAEGEAPMVTRWRVE
jgi:lipid-binding SYLF domain-containing protein